MELALEGQEITSTAEIETKGGDVIAAVAKDPGAIGFVALHDEAQGGVKTLSIDGAPMAETTMLTGRYPLVRPLYYVTRGKPGALETSFIEFATSADGQALIQEAGALRVY